MFSAKAQAALLMAALVGLGLVGCGEEDHGEHASSVRTASNGDVFNDADVSFAQHMIPHHAQAVSMVVLTQGRPLDPEVENLAMTIRESQVLEVEAMTDWLTAWDEEVPETSLDHSNAGHDMSDMGGDDMGGMGGDMPGMMSADEMRALEEASDAEFQDLWLDMMIEHHTGAIEMAEAEQRDGEFEDAVTLAESIAASQQREIDTMTELVG